jgi:hypothetical protein
VFHVTFLCGWPAPAGLHDRRSRGDAKGRLLRCQPTSFSAQRVLNAADGISHLTFGLVGHPFAFKLGIAESFSDRFLYTAFGLFDCALDRFFVHDMFQMLPAYWIARDRYSVPNDAKTRPAG